MTSVITKHTTKTLKLNLPYRTKILALFGTQVNVGNNEIEILAAEPTHECRLVPYEFFLITVGTCIQGAYLGTLPNDQHVFYRASE